MATYLPNVKDYIPKTETFTPNYKFLSDVLDVRQDRYNNNYKQMNNLYGDVVHADLSRADNKSTRDQYTEHLVPKMKQIAGLDLSLQENVDSAKALFKPFYENENLVRDLVYTKAFKKQTARGQALYNSNDPEERRKYWDGAQQFLQFKLEDFVDATGEESMNKPLPKWVDKMDLVTDGVAALKELDMNIEDVRFTPNGQWKITQKNGSLLRAQPTGIRNKEGNMTYTDPAGDYIKAVVLQDPKMLDYYRTKAYVEARSFSEDNQQTYGDKNAAMDFWINDQITKYTTEGQRVIDDLSQKEADQKVNKEHWEQYKKRNGIISDSQEEVEWLSTLGELESLKQAKAAVQKTYNEVTKDGMGPNDQLTKAYIARMSYLIAKDVDIAANAYANKDASSEWTETKSWLEKVKQNNRLALENVKQTNRKELKDYNNAPIMLKGVPHNWQGDLNANAARFSLDEDNEDVTNIKTINQDNAIRDKKEEMKIQLDKYNEVLRYYNLLNASTGNPTSTEDLFKRILPVDGKLNLFKPTMAPGSGVGALKEFTNKAFTNAWTKVQQGQTPKNWDELQEEVNNGDDHHVNLLYDNMINEINGFDGTNSWLSDHTEMVNDITRLDAILDGKELMIAGSIKRTRAANKASYELVTNTDSGGMKFKALLDEYNINVFDDDFDFKDEETFVEDFVDALRFQTINIQGEGFVTPGITGNKFWSHNKEMNQQIQDLKPNIPFYKTVQEEREGYGEKRDKTKGFLDIMKDGLNNPSVALNAGAGNLAIGGLSYVFDEAAASDKARENYQIMNETMNEIQQKGTGTDESFQVHNADAWYEGSEQYGSGSTITAYSGGAMDIANSANDNPGEYQFDQFIKNYLEDKGTFIIKIGDQTVTAKDMESHPQGAELLKQIYISSQANADSDKSKENRLQLDIRYNENIGGKELAFLDGDAEQEYSGVVMQFNEKFANIYLDPIMREGKTKAQRPDDLLTDNTITVLWPKEEFSNQHNSENQPRHHYEDYLINKVPVVVEVKGGGKVIFRNVYDQGNVINTIQAERYVVRWDDKLHQYVNEPVDVTQLDKNKGDFETWENLEINTTQSLLQEQIINQALKASDKGYNAKK
tara:strand:- start:2566 stop:5880 length:3315 start_codon:yes stop_codon:yes gene_type:complete